MLLTRVHIEQISAPLKFHSGENFKTFLSFSLSCFFRFVLVFCVVLLPSLPKRQQRDEAFTLHRKVNTLSRCLYFDFRFTQAARLASQSQSPFWVIQEHLMEFGLRVMMLMWRNLTLTRQTIHRRPPHCSCHFFKLPQQCRLVVGQCSAHQSSQTASAPARQTS